MSKEDFIEKIKEIKISVPDEEFFIEYNKAIYNIIDARAEVQQRIDKIEKCIKEYKEMGYSKYDENEIEIELIDKILEILGGENNR